MAAFPLSGPSADPFTKAYDGYFQAANKQFRPEGPDWRDDRAQGIQESGLNPLAVSPVGAGGIMQIMPPTWGQLTKALGWGNVSVQSAQHNIVAGVFYQTSLDRQWSGRGRTIVQRHELGLPSYNAGLGNILKAQALCHDAKLWRDIVPCLSQVTGRENARQTIGYGPSIMKWRAQMGLLWPCRWTGHRGGCAPAR